MALKPGELDDDVARLYREASCEQPPTRIDSAIGRAARDPSAVPAAAGTQRWWNRWQLPLAAATVALVSVSLVALVWEEGGRQPVPTTETAPAQLAREETAPSRESAADSARASAGTLPDAPSTPPPAPLPAPFSEPPFATDLARPGAPVPDAQLAAEHRALRAEPAAPTVAAPAPAQTARRTTEREGPADPAAAAPVLPAAVVGHVKALEREAPHAWIERIAQLRREGRGDEADALLAEFRRRYPAQAIPPATK